MEKYIPIVKMSRTEITLTIPGFSTPVLIFSTEVSRIINLEGFFYKLLNNSFVYTYMYLEKDIGLSCVCVCVFT